MISEKSNEQFKSLKMLIILGPKIPNLLHFGHSKILHQNVTLSHLSKLNFKPNMKKRRTDRRID